MVTVWRLGSVCAGMDTQERIVPSASLRHTAMKLVATAPCQGSVCAERATVERTVVCAMPPLPHVVS
jgi:hypothetical protein